MKKVTKSKFSAWKPLKLEGAIISQGVEGLIGIEELTDYKLERNKKRGKTIISERQTERKTATKNKRRQNLDSDSDENPGKSAAKKRKLDKLGKREEKKRKKQRETRRKKKIVQPMEQESGIESDEKLNSGDEDDAQMSETEVDVIDDSKSNINVESWSSLGVPNIIIKALADQNFEAPTPIQALTLAPAIFGRRDILGAAETGSGKTLAFGIPILNGILELKKIQQTLEDDDMTDDLISEDEEHEIIHDDLISDDEENEDSDDEQITEDEENERSDDEQISEDEENDPLISEDDQEISDDEELEEESENEDIEDEGNEDAAESEQEGSDESDYEEREEIIGDELLTDGGIGCVRAIDNIQIEGTQGFPRKPLYALILTPTRELAIQVKNHLVKAAKYTGIRIAVVVGGMAAVKQERILSKGPEIVVATPGRLWELIQEGNMHLSQVNNIKYLAVDETDRMVERGHFQELHNLLEKINMDESKLKERQTFVFSATLTMVHDIPQHLLKKKTKRGKNKVVKLTPGQKLQKVIEMLGMSDPKIVDVTKQSGTAGSLTECRIACTMDHKDFYLYYLLKRHPGRTLVFCNSIGCVRRLATLFGILECKPLPLHASMQQRQRLRNLERFQADDNGVLIATDVAARGLDIPNVEHVIHYQVPRTSESYVHRSGRTARAQKEGITILMMEPSEMQYYTRLCRTLGRTQDLPTFPVVDRLLVAVKERVNVAREIDKLELRCKRDNVQKGWLQRAVEDMDLVLDEDQLESTMELKETADLRRLLKGKKQHLKSLLSKPLFPKGFSGKYPDTSVQMHLQQDSQKAVDVMKQAIEEKPKSKRMPSAGLPKSKQAFRMRKKKKGRKASKH